MRALATVLVGAALGGALGGCSTGPLADLPQSIGGLPAGAPARPETPAAFPAVHDMPPQRRETLLEPDEQKRIQQDLERARDQQESKAGIVRPKSKAKSAAKSEAKPQSDAQK
jgi:hypothetical protein